MNYKLKRYNKVLLTLISALVIIGCVIVFSASSLYSLEKSSNFAAFFNHHLKMVGIGFFAFLIGMVFPYQYYSKLTKWLMLAIVIALLLTIAFGTSVKGATRWLNIGIIKFQPSELAKIILIIHLSFMIYRLEDRIKSLKHGLIYPLIWIGLVAFLIVLQPNLSTATIVSVVGLTMLFVGGARFIHIGGIGVLAVSLLAIVMISNGYSQKRIDSFFQSSENAGRINDQVYQARIGLGSGGLSGVGLGESRQANLFVSESYGDFIFSILGEELGFFGTIIVSTMYLLVFFISLLQIKHVRDKFGQMLIFGLSFNLVLTAFINILVVLGLTPTTGITLPFISYGGSAITMFALSIGIIINVTNEGRVLRLRKRFPKLGEYVKA